MTDFQAFLIPRQDASPEELKRLGEAIYQWNGEEQAANVPAFIDPLPVEDLRSGELPMPLALRETIGPCNIPRELLELIEKKGGDPSQVSEEELEEIGVGFQPPELGALQAAKKRLGAAANLRGVRLGYSPSPIGGIERFREKVELNFPAEVIEDILIDGVSWNDT